MQGPLMEKFDAKRARIRRRRKVAPAVQLKNDNNNVEAGNQQGSKKGNRPSLKNDQQRPIKGRVRSRWRGQGRARRHGNTTSQNGPSGVNSDHPQQPNDSFMNQDDDDKAEEEVQNNKVSPSCKTEKNMDNFSSVPSNTEKGEEDRQYLLGFGEEESSSERPRNNYCQTLLGTKTAEYLAGCFGTAKRVLCSKLTSTNAIIKWVLMVLNVVLETCQAVLTQEESQGKMGRKIYLKLSIITSFISLTMSLFEAFHKGRKAGAKWRRRGHCCWFYNPGEKGQLFGGYMLYFGILCSLVQLVVNLAAKFSNKDFIEFDYVPLLLSACHLVAAVIGSGEKNGGLLATVNCRMHGCNLAEGKKVDGGEGWVFECPICHEDIP